MTELSPFHEHARTARTHSTAYAQEGIKVLTILNGGALAAIPIATEAFKAINIPFPVLLTGAGFFAFGLLSVALVCLLAYATEDCNAMAYHHYAEGEDEEGNRYHRIQGRYRWPAIGFAFASWLAFVGGCGWMFLGAQNRFVIEWEPYVPGAKMTIEQYMDQPPAVTPDSQ